MNATGRSIDDVESQLSELMWFSDETSYSFTDMTSNVGKFTSQNIGLEDSVQAMMGIANAAALAGANSTEASRAMYNISQAMGVGSMKLIDWKSIENANMATSQFKQAMIDAAVEVGTLKKKSDGLWVGVNTAGKEYEVTVESFREELAQGWLSTDAMMTAFKRFGDYSNTVFEKATEDGLTCAEAMEALGDDYDELAMRAFKAAQEAKTFADMVEATKDAVSSQWSKIFQEIFGNYEEAKEVWTWWANSLYELFADPLWDTADMFAEWHDLGGYQKAVEGVATVWWSLADAINVAKWSWEQVIPKMDSDKLLGITESFQKGATKMYEFFHGDEGGAAAQDFVDRYEEAGKTIDWMAENWYNGDKMRAKTEYAKYIVENYYDDLENATKAFNGDQEAAIEYLAGYFIDEYDNTYEEANNVLGTFETRINGFVHTFEGIASVVDIIKQAFGGFKTGILDPLMKRLPGFLTKTLGFTGSIGEKITAFAANLRENNFFGNFFKNIGDKIFAAGDKIAEFLEKAKGLESVQKLSQHLNDFWGWLTNLPSGLLERVTGFFHDLKEDTGGITMEESLGVLDSIVNGINWSIDQVIAAWPSVVSFVENLIGHVEDLAAAVMNFFGGPDWQAFKTFVGAMFSNGWTDLTSALTGIGDFFTNYISNLISEGTLKTWGQEGAEQVIQGFTNAVKNTDWMGLVSKIGIVAFLGKLAMAVTSLFGAVVDLAKNGGLIAAGISKIMESLNGVAKGMSRELNARALLEVAGAIAILVLAIWGLALLPEDLLAQAVATIIMVGTIMAIIINVLAKFQAAKAERALNESTNIFGVLDHFATQAGKGVKKFMSKLGTAAILKSVGKMILMIALSIGIIVGAIMAFDKYRSAAPHMQKSISLLMQIFNPIIGLVTFIFIIITIFATFEGSMATVGYAMEQFGKLFTRIGTAMILLVASIAAIAALDKAGYDVDGAVTSIAGMMAVLIGVVLILTIIEKFIGSTNLDNIVKVFNKLTASLLLIALALSMMGLLMNTNEMIIAAASLSLVAGVLALAVAALAVAANTITQNDSMDAFNQLSSAMIKMAVAILVIAAAAALLSTVGVTFTDVALAVGAFVVALIALVALGALVGKLQFIGEGLNILGTALLMIGGTIALAGIGVLAFAAGIALLAQNSGAIPGIFVRIGIGIVAFSAAVNSSEGALSTFLITMAVVAIAAIAVGFAVAKIVQAFAMVLQYLGPFISEIAKVMPKAKTVLIAGAALIIAGLLEYLGVSIPTLVDTVVKLILLAIESLALAIINNSDEIGSAVMSVVEALTALILIGLLGMLETLLGGIPGVGSKIRSAIEGLEAGLGAGTENSIERLQEGIETNIDEIKDSAGEKLFNAGKENGEEYNKGVSEGASDGKITINPTVEAGWDTTDVYNEKFGRNTTVESNVRITPQISDEDAAGVTDWLNDAGKVRVTPQISDEDAAGVTDWLNGLGDTSSEAGAETGAAYGSSFMEYLGGELENVDGLDMDFTSVSEGWTGDLEDGWDTSQLLSMMGYTGDDGINLLNGYDGLYGEAGAGWTDSTAEGMESESGNAIDAAYYVGDQSVEAVEEKYWDMNAAGHYLMSGLVEGMENHAPTVYAKANTIANNVKRIIGNAFLVESPSKFTIGIGQYLMDGLRIGMGNAAGKVYSSLENVTGNTLNVLNDAVARIQGIMEMDVDTSPTITPVIDLSNFQNGVQSMESSFAGFKPGLNYGGIGRVMNLGTLHNAIESTANNTDVVNAIREMRSDIGMLGDEISKMQIVMDTGALVGATSRSMDRSLGRIATYKARGN